MEIQNRITDQIRKLQGERERLVGRSPEEALERILEHPQAVALVHSFPEEDLYLLIQDVGPEDAIPILALASNRQWEYILDMEVWDADRVDSGSTTRWLQLLYRADSGRLAKWLGEDKAEFADLFFYRNVEIRNREHDQDPSEFGDDFMTFDDVTYFKVVPEAPDGLPTADIAEKREDFIPKLLGRMAEIDFNAFQKLSLEIPAVIPAETEEENYRLRNVRLAEKGFLPFEEAVGIYQPITPEKFTTRVKEPFYRAIPPGPTFRSLCRRPGWSGRRASLPGPFGPSGQISIYCRFKRNLPGYATR
jgi:hypothetical protein